MEKLEQLYEGKAKKVFRTGDPDVLVIEYKEDAGTLSREKQSAAFSKGAANNKMSNHMMALLEKQGIPTHFVKELGGRETAVRKAEIVPLEVVVRNLSAGSFVRKFGIEEGRRLLCPTLEFSYKDDALGDPMVNSYQAVALGAATREEIDIITTYAFRINEAMEKYFVDAGITLVDFKVEFGRYHGKIILADEISPETCRLWDAKTKEKLDKDRFRRNPGNVEDIYREIFTRLGIR